jgi:predicted secreted hydrolase
LLAASPVRAQESFRHATAPRAWEFPRDHGSHPDYAMEWWYFTGSLFDADGARFGYELTFFRVALRPDLPEVADRSPMRARDLVMAHFTITDVAQKRFHQTECMQRAAAGLAGARAESLDVWIGDWSARAAPDGRVHLQADAEDMGLDLWLQASRPPVLHGDGGLSWKDVEHAEASYYYSRPRMHSVGSLRLGEKSRAVSGSTWMDHEFFTGPTPSAGLGWDWFSARLDDGRDLMLYRVRREGQPPTIFGTAVGDGQAVRALDTTGIEFHSTRTWKSPRTGASYPVEWEVELPAEALRMTVRPALDDQEVLSLKTVGFSYWEGLSDYDVVWHGDSLKGEGYLELTGYPGAKIPRESRR